mgnify:FL=1|tara:strand:- start:1278 stop:1583 length:306 start_codon:yes stop_codon:yes gene_type:complete
MEITNESLYSDLKEWFLDNMDKFPKKLEAGYVYYYDVKFTANNYLIEIEREIKRFGYENIGYSPIAGVRKKMLFELYEQLKVKENWEKEKVYNSLSNDLTK